MAYVLQFTALIGSVLSKLYCVLIKRKVLGNCGVWLCNIAYATSVWGRNQTNDLPRTFFHAFFFFFNKCNFIDQHFMHDYTTKLKRSALVRGFCFQSKILCYCVVMV